MICSRYFSEIPCMAAISFTLIHSPLLFNARSSMTRTAYLPLVEIFILSSFPSIFLLCFTFHISLLIPKQFKTAPIFLWFPQILPYFFFIFLFPIVHIGFVETTEKSGEHPPECCSEKSPPIPRNALRIFALLYWHFTLLVRITPPL